jgi:hypothetical protein
MASNISTVTAALKNFITANVYIGSEDLDPPKHWQAETNRYACTLTVLPAYELVYTKISTNIVTGLGKFRFQLKYRLPSQLPYNGLNVGAFERLAQFLQLSPMLNFGGGAEGIRSIQSTQIDYPIVIEREERQQNDWIIYVNVEYLIDFQVTEYDLPDEFALVDPDLDTSVEVRNIGINTYRSDIGDFDDNVLDSNNSISLVRYELNAGSEGGGG